MKDFSLSLSIASSQRQLQSQRRASRSKRVDPLWINWTRTVTVKRWIVYRTARNLFGRRRKNARSAIDTPIKTSLRHSPSPLAIPLSRFFRLKFTPAAIPLQERRFPGYIPLHFSIDRVLSRVTKSTLQLDEQLRRSTFSCAVEFIYFPRVIYIFSYKYSTRSTINSISFQFPISTPQAT